MYYIVALGNPGEEYEHTRHNVGWLVLDELVRAMNLPKPVFSAKYQGRLSEGTIETQPIIVLYPDTFMNHSGAAVKKLVSQKEIDRLIVIHDDIALPLGEIKISTGRGDGGHNGIRSIIEQLGSKDFIRLRIGIAQKSFFTGVTKRPSGEKLPRFVLGKFTKREEMVVAKIIGTIKEAISVLVTAGVGAAMNRFNT